MIKGLNALFSLALGILHYFITLFGFIVFFNIFFIASMQRGNCQIANEFNGIFKYLSSTIPNGILIALAISHFQVSIQVQAISNT